MLLYVIFVVLHAENGGTFFVNIIEIVVQNKNQFKKKLYLCAFKKFRIRNT